MSSLFTPRDSLRSFEAGRCWEGAAAAAAAEMHRRSDVAIFILIFSLVGSTTWWENNCREKRERLFRDLNALVVVGWYC